MKDLKQWLILLLEGILLFLIIFNFFRIDEMSERIDDLESTVTKLVEESNQNQIGNNMEGNSQEIDYNK